MGKWNDTDEPIAFLITFRTYGTWLPGDERGSIDKYHNKYGGPRAVASEARSGIHSARLRSEPFLLNADARTIVEAAIKEVCKFREWYLIALAVRTNHVHAVISGNCDSAKMLNDLKAYSTRRLREASIWGQAHSPWVDKGSRRYLWTEEHVGAASNYVLNGQDGPLPEFDRVDG
ncbi:MAG: transposase [Chloracidobacterium sp.]|nr:transposase [Chloracidobacterium sp.]MCO5334505.1 transposase [Pyrinomonadaceae bacterium]